MTRPTPLIVVGAGGFGRELLDLIADINQTAPSPAWTVVGVLDDNPSDLNLELLRDRAIPYLGPVDSALEKTDAGSYVIGVGAPDARRAIAQKLDSCAWRAATLVHPTATVGSAVRIGEGTVICAGVRLTTHIELGRHVHLNLNVTIGHDSIIGDFVSVNPHASVSGDCEIRDAVLIGVAGVVLNGRTVGAGSVVGGAACVTRDVDAGKTVVGVPARPVPEARLEIPPERQAGFDG